MRTSASARSSMTAKSCSRRASRVARYLGSVSPVHTSASCGTPWRRTLRKRHGDLAAQARDDLDDAPYLWWPGQAYHDSGVRRITLMARQDPTKVDPQHYSVEAENERVRVLRVKYGPREKSKMHSHPALVAVFLTTGRIRFTYSDGKSEEITGE